ncbi:MAG: EAL domain-containing protein [Desulfuromonadales bacterium]|nr:EAL domain-containing protein [Desulfuromonadales bacterium]
MHRLSDKATFLLLLAALGTTLALLAVALDLVWSGIDALSPESAAALILVLAGAITLLLLLLLGPARHAHRQNIEEKMARLAYYDSLTGLPNRSLLEDRMRQAIAQAQRDSRQVGIFFFDLDRFKTINDTLGHAVGDQVLQAVAQRLRRLIRSGDTIARLGGDEFVIIQADPNHDPSFTTLARRIHDTLNAPLELGERILHTTASIGVAVYPLDGEDSQTLLKCADTAMYVAKSRGRNNVQFFSREMNARAVAKSSLETRLRAALASGDLTMHYQAQVELATGRLTGFEALLRMHDEEGEPIPPARVIAIAEESGLIHPLGEWTLHQACRQSQLWHASGLPAVRMAVNLSGHHARQSDFTDRIDAILQETGINPVQLELELSELSLMDHLHEALSTLTDLKVRGIQLAIDDFGRGHSPLLGLMHLPIQRIKIDQEFIGGLHRNDDYRILTETIIAMADHLRLAVSGVGVETASQAEFLLAKGCREAQGNYFSGPLDADAATALLRRQQPFPVPWTSD